MQFFNLHLRSIISAMVKIINNPLDNLLNVLTISAIITLLCSILAITTSKNNWQQNNNIFPQIVVYLKDNAKKDDVSKIEDILNKHHRKLISSYQFISKEEGLEQLNQESQLKQIASEISSTNLNPLPDVLIISTKATNKKQLQELNNRVQALPMVSEVQIDENYVEKINDLMNFAGHLSVLAQIALAAILVIVVYNMIRLQMLLRQDEILVSRLIGASDSSIMRPLAYYAVFQIIISSCLSFFLVNSFINYINHLLLSSEHLFGNSFFIPHITSIQLIQLIGVLIIFTLFAVFIAVRWVFKNSYSK